jgi:hypothetical protein
MMPRTVAAAVVTLVCIARAPVAAQDLHAPVTVFDNVSIANINHAIYVQRGTTAARIADGVFTAPPTVDAATQTLTIATNAFCDAPVPSGSVTFTFHQLKARLDNVEAYALHKQKKYAESKAGFAKALARDPANRTIAVNLASAQQLLGEPTEAVKTLAPWINSEPIATYVTVAGDPELAPLLLRPALAALKAKTAGTVIVTATGLKGGVAFAKAANLLAVERHECDWGTGVAKANACASHIELFEASGKRIVSLPLSNFDGANQKRNAQRRQVAQAVLRDLGFVAEAVVHGKVTSTGTDREPAKTKFALASLKLGVVGFNRMARVLRGNTLVVETPTMERLLAVDWAPTANAFIFHSGRFGSEICETTDPTRVDVVPAPASAATTSTAPQ